MDVSSVSSSMGAMSQFSTESLTDDQKSTLEEILSNYDAENITEDETKSLMDEIKDAGIAPSEESKELIETAGFSMEPPEGEAPQGPPPEEGAMQTMQEMNPEVASIFEQFQNGEIDEDELKSQLEEYKPDMGEFPGDFTDMFV